MRSDAELVAEAKAGDEAACRLLVQRHEQLVRSTVTGMLGVGPEAEDVAQEVFIRFFRSLEQYRGASQLSTYLCRIAINLSINALKSRRRRYRWLPIGRTGEDPVLDIPDHSEDPALRDTREWVHKAIGMLEPDFRAVIVLRMIDGYSVRETAEILNIPEGTVASRLARAQVKLRQIFEKWRLLD
jgi:RNA polymerase sigma-70 factor (ECF subfamily)